VHLRPWAAEARRLPAQLTIWGDVGHEPQNQTHCRICSCLFAPRLCFSCHTVWSLSSHSDGTTSLGVLVGSSGPPPDCCTRHNPCAPPRMRTTQQTHMDIPNCGSHKLGLTCKDLNEHCSNTSWGVYPAESFTSVCTQQSLPNVPYLYVMCVSGHLRRLSGVHHPPALPDVP